MIVSYNWLKDYLGEDIPTPEKLAELLTFHSFEIESVEEVGEDTVIDVKILPDRASDCLSHRGIAHEIAALLDQPLVHDPLRTKPDMQATDAIAVTIADTAACPRFTASLVTGIEVKESPQWLKDRLQALGQRSINNIVDATNYVMYAVGQPLHAYDAEKFPQVDGKWRFGVRPAAAGETVSLLAEGGKDEDRTVLLRGGELLIIDESNNTAIGLAGVKGGRFAGVDVHTTKIIIEAAHFHPGLTRKTARGLGIVIDASKRFENEPSRELPSYAQAEIVKLITDIAGGKCEGFYDIYPEPKTPPTVVVDPQRVNALLGLSLAVDEMVKILNRVGVTVTEAGGMLSCVGPFERTDLNIEADFIDEIGRIHGYTHVTSVVPEAVPLPELNQLHYYSELVRARLMAAGFSEVITSSFRQKDAIQLQNALASDKSHLRSSLTKNIAEVLDKNAPFIDLLGLADVRVFEIGTVFEKTADSVTEHVALALGLRLKQSGYSQKEDKALDAIVTDLETLLGTTLVFVKERGVYECNWSEVVATLPAPDSYEPVKKSGDVQYQPFSLFPAVTRDIAMWVPEGTKLSVVETVLNDAAGTLRVRTTHVDTFTKDGRTSLAFRLVFQSNEKTLTDAEVNEVMDGVYKAAEAEGWETR